MSTDSSNDDRRKIDCAQNPGVRGQDFETWKEEYQRYAEAEYPRDSDFSFWEATQGRIQGDANGPAMPAQGGALAGATRKKRVLCLAVKRNLSLLQTDKRLAT